MKEDVNVRIIRRLKESKYNKNVKEFIIEMIRNEFENSELHHWNYGEVYDEYIKKYAKVEE